ncbi:unnamed protein product [Effrenium voratum]|nr:unnamed protein product [Effrenium voratum]
MSMQRGFGRSPTFLVNTEQQRSNLDALVRREQHLAEQYQKNKPLMFNGNAYQKTHPQKAANPGHRDADATVVSPMLLGCADGVSQIEEYGLDASLLPRELLDACEEQAMNLLVPDQAGKISGLYKGPIPLMREVTRRVADEWLKDVSYGWQAFESTDSLGSTTVCPAAQPSECCLGTCPPLCSLAEIRMPWNCPALQELNVQWTLKRDDLTGLELSGNKTRKLEFFMADAMAKACDVVVTVGGLQSNHCRATAAAARLLGLEAHLVLLVKDSMVDQDPGLQGNLLLSRLTGAHLHLIGAKEYYALGGDLSAAERLNQRVASELATKGRRPYVIPVGGTAPLGTWGYLQAVEELQLQMVSPECREDYEEGFDHVVVACGSGGTFAGLAVGLHLAGGARKLHGVNIQHTPAAYRALLLKEAEGLGCSKEQAELIAQQVEIHPGGGGGYANASEAELQFLVEVAKSSGVVLDHVYSGKALFHFCEHARAHPDDFRNSRILFWHTGGLFGLYSQEERLGLSVLDNSTRIHGKLHPMMAIVSIGDCELMVLRQNRLRYEIAFNTEMQRIDGNCQCPLQVCRVDGRVDPNFDERMTIEA